MSDMDQVLSELEIPRDKGEPVFDEPWQAQAFALTVKLSEAGHFTWGEWADLFGAEIAAATQAGKGSGNENYYLCWLAALEKIVGIKGIVSAEQLNKRKEQWRQANAHTDHGKPIELSVDH